MLSRKKITLLDPANWDDRNDAYYLDLYTKKKKHGSTLALCLTQKNETYHHWSVFTSRGNGVCIVFDKEKLVAFLETQKDIMHGPVKYMTLPKMKKATLSVEDLPFLKRYAFADESEYRLIYPSSEAINEKHIKLPIDSIIKISVSPWAPDAFFEIIKETIGKIDSCEKLKVGKSSLVNNKEWRKIGEKLRDQK